MNKHLPYVWRKSYCNDERRSQNFLKIAHEKARQHLSRAATSSARQSNQQFGTRQWERQYSTFATNRPWLQKCRRWRGKNQAE